MRGTSPLHRRTAPTRRRVPGRPLLAALALSLAGAVAWGLGAATALGHGAPASGPGSDAPLRDYVAAHKDVREPRPLAGGPVQVEVRQTAGGVHVGLPVERRLDPQVFGTPEDPRRTGGTPLVDGVPEEMRAVEDGHYTTTSRKTPTGDTKSLVLPGGRMTLEAWDRTATDAAVTEDEVEFEATWEDEQGNTYGARCCTRMVPHGIEMPTFGGVVTNHMLHGSTGIWTALMPTFFSPVTFWGYGDLLKNGEVVDSDRLIHGMVTEYVRTEGYRMAFDRQVTPTRTHFHLMVFAARWNWEAGRIEKQRVSTGFMLPNGKELPFWHVMFGNLEMTSGRGAAASASTEARSGAVSPAAATAGGDEPAAVVTLTRDLTFEPRTVRIRAGETVRWKNPSPLVHSVAADPDAAADPAHVALPEGARPFDSGSIAPGESYSRTFRVPGTYKLVCEPHEGAHMLGTVVVTGQNPA